jgi:hypothetical protein
MFDFLAVRKMQTFPRSGVIFAGEESYESTIYSNQLMSYVMVSLPAWSSKEFQVKELKMAIYSGFIH